MLLFLFRLSSWIDPTGSSGSHIDTEQILRLSYCSRKAQDSDCFAKQISISSFGPIHRTVDHCLLTPAFRGGDSDNIRTAHAECGSLVRKRFIEKTRTVIFRKNTLITCLVNLG